MKNIFKLSALAVLAIGALVSCEEKEIAAPEVASVAETHTFTVTIATPDTKVAVTEQGKTTWEVGDKILVHGETDADRAVVTLAAGDISADGKTATISFTGVRPYDRSSDRGYTSVYYAQYPAEISTEGSLYYYAKFDKTNDFLLAGYNEGDKFILYNLCGVISFKADGDFDSYTFAGNNGETVGYELLASRLAGKGEGNEPVLEWKYSHTKGALTSIDGVATPNQPAFVCLPLGADFTKGFTLTLKKGEAEVAKLVTENPVNVERGKILPLGDITSKIGGGAAILKFEWRVEADTLVNVAYNEAGAAHWYVEKDADVEYVFKVYTDDGNVYTENGPGITIEPAANHVAINYAANDLLIPRKWMVTATTTATNVENQTLTAILIQGAYEYTDLAKLNADIIAAGDKEVERIVDLSAGVEITKISGKNVFAQNSTGGVLLYGTGLESKGMDANGGNAIVGKFVVKTKAFKGLPEITGVVSQSADAKIGAWSGQYPCFTRTIAQIEGEYAKYVNAKCKIVNVEVTKAFGQTKTGEIKDASGSLAIYNYSTDLTEDVPVGAKAEYAIVWPTVYNTHQLGFYKASQLKLTSCPGVVTVAATKSIAAGETFELGATTNSTGALSYASSDEAVATVSDAGLVTAVAAGTATITVSVAADGIYTAGSAECVVTVTAGAVATVLYSRVGAETPASWAGTYLMVYAKNGPQVLSSISDTSTKYGVGSRVTINEDATITQTDELKACEVTIAAASDGNADHYVMMFNGKYLTWTSGNSLNVADAESDNTRWTLAVGTAATGNVIITNVADSARQLWYNESSPRFACYTGKTETTSNYAPAQLFKLME